MESPAFRRFTITTTALVHSSTPPGFIANEKNWSPKGKVKTPNGCVVQESEKITLLKRGYVAPVRRSSRVRRKGCALLPGSRVKYRHSEPISVPQLNGRAGKSARRSYQRSADSTPVRSGVRGTVGRPVGSSSSPSAVPAPNGPQGENGLTAPESRSPGLAADPSEQLLGKDFFHADGTPRRALMVKISDTPKMKQILAADGVTRKGLPADVSLSYEALSSDRPNPSATPLGAEAESGQEIAGPCPKSTEQNSDIFGAFLDFSSGSDSEDEFAESPRSQCASQPRPVSFDDRQRANTKDVDRDSFQDQETKPDSVVSCLTESNSDSMDQSDSLGNWDFDGDLVSMRDAGDEVLCISPIPFKMTDARCSPNTVASQESPWTDGDARTHGYPNTSTFLPIKQNGEVAIGPPTPPGTVTVHTPNSCTGTCLSDDVICACTCVPFSDDGRRVAPEFSPSGQAGLVVSPAERDCGSVDFLCVPPVNGLRSRQLLMSLSVSVSPESMTESSSSSGGGGGSGGGSCGEQFPAQGQNRGPGGGGSTTYFTPSRGAEGSLRGKELSPSYASQANSESPFTPRSANCQNEDCEESASHAPPSARPSTGRSGDSSAPSQDDNFQDFSEFEYILSGVSSQPAFLEAIASPAMQAVRPPVVAQFPSICCHTSSATASSATPTNRLCGGVAPKCDWTPSAIAGGAQPSVLAVGEKQTEVNWSRLLESDSAHYSSRPPDSSGDSKLAAPPPSSAPALSAEGNRKPGRRRSKKPVSQRSSLRIARRMSLLTVDQEAPSNEEIESNASACTDGPDPVQRAHEAPLLDTHMMFEQVVDSDQESNTETRQLIQSALRSLSPHCLSGDSTGYMDPSVSPQGLSGSRLPAADVAEDSGPAQSQSRDSGSCGVSPGRPRTSKPPRKPSLRQSLRLGNLPDAVKDGPETSATDSLCSAAESAELLTHNQADSSRSESTLYLEDFRFQFDRDVEVTTTKKPTDLRQKQKHSRRRSARLGRSEFPVADDPCLVTAEAEEDRCPPLPPLNSSSFAGLTSDGGPVADILDERFLGSVVQIMPAVDVSGELPPPGSDYSEPSERKKRRPGKEGLKRRRSARLLRLSLLDSDCGSDISSLSDARSQNDPMEDAWLDSGSYMSDASEEFATLEENGLSSMAAVNSPYLPTESGDLDIDQELAYETDSSGATGAATTTDAETFSEEHSPLEDPDEQPQEAGRRRRSTRRKSIIPSRAEFGESRWRRESREEEEEAVKEIYLKRGEDREPKHNSLETIFEEAHARRNCGPTFMGLKKFKRTVVFPKHPWLPRKKKRTPKGRSGPKKGKRRTAKDPNIDKKLEALLAEWTPVSPLVGLSPSNARKF